MTITLPATTRNVAEQQQVKEKELNRIMLMKIISSVIWLARQRLPLRGDGYEEDGNFLQLLRLQGTDDDKLFQWLKRKANKYTSHVIQKDILKVMSTQVLGDISSSLRESTFIALMLNETADISNNEQTTVVLRRVTEAFDS